MLAATESDILLLLDAPNAFPEPFDSETAGIISAISISCVGLPSNFRPGTLTRCLVEELGSISSPPLSDVILHARLSQRFNDSFPLLPERVNEPGMANTDRSTLGDTGMQQTPIYKFLSWNRPPRPIYLKPLQEAETSSMLDRANLTNSSQENAEWGHYGRSGLRSPNISISALVGQTTLNQAGIDEWVHWLLNAPSEVQFVEASASSNTEMRNTCTSSLPLSELPAFSFATEATPGTFAGSTLGSSPEPSSGSLGPKVLGDDQLKCHLCGFVPQGKTKNIRAYLHKHAKVHRTREVKCPRCSKLFTRQDNLTVHMERVHNNAYH